jgi:hypothetical protein
VEHPGGFAQTTGFRASKENGGDELQRSIKSVPIGSDCSWLYRDRFDQIIVFVTLVSTKVRPSHTPIAADYTCPSPKLFHI